jgi:hypothetical protein
MREKPAALNFAAKNGIPFISHSSKESINATLPFSAGCMLYSQVAQQLKKP